MKVTAKYALLVVAALALVAVWYIHRNKLVSEGFSAQVPQSGNLLENFNTPQKEAACKTYDEQINMYSAMIKENASTDEDKKMREDVLKTVEMLKQEKAKVGC
jgi:hypothetical protein